MNDRELAAKVRSAVYLQCRSRGFAAPVDVLMDVGYLSKLSLVMREMRSYAAKVGLKPSFCYYKWWGTKKKNGQGRKPVIPLRFSKSGDPEIERRYATHYVDAKRTSQLKEERAAKQAGQLEAAPDGGGAANS